MGLSSTSCAGNLRFISAMWSARSMYQRCEDWKCWDQNLQEGSALTLETSSSISNWLQRKGVCSQGRKQTSAAGNWTSNVPFFLLYDFLTPWPAV